MQAAAFLEHRDRFLDRALGLEIAQDQHVVGDVADFHAGRHIAADDALLYDLDLLTAPDTEVPLELRVAPYRLEPTAWTEHRCPACCELYGLEFEKCPLDGQPLDEVVVSNPFLWLG